MNKSWVKILFVIACIAVVVEVFMVWGKSSEAKPANAGAPLAEVTVPDNFSEEAKRGEIAFNESCASCHGTNAAGQDGVAPPLVHIYYEPNHHSDMAFMMAMTRGAQAHHWSFGNMPPAKGVSEDEAKDIIAYVRELQRANGIE